ncbi:Invertase [Conoideocrella luteorostrata]|uniref:Invertase n=1 Tax=Conoideocrella luteorostrata TaxID=1105319 RepID=A0AAJ0FS66_9HYPO|nr:Invertase [Conoideocrella luteorostrata]
MRSQPVNLLISLSSALQLASYGLGLDYSSTTPHGTSTLTSIATPTSGFSVGANVPSGSPVVGNYAGQYRPQVHYSPPTHFMNDPNGMFRDENNTWHLYYQYSPQNVAGNQHWGHATSMDLYHWTNQPIALFPPKKNVHVFSGSAVVDTNNTSGLFPNQTNGVVLIYTLSETYADDAPGPQTQAIAYSHDGGFNFIPYEHNPVIASNSSQFRDPKVIWYEDHWVMVVAFATEFVIGIYTSPNLIDWTLRSNFSDFGLLGLQWECPNLVYIPYYDDQGQKLDDVWTMVISINPGAPLGGCITEYYPGKFNGTHFEAFDSVTRLTDFGKDNYAAQFFHQASRDHDPVHMAWASNWQYTQTVPTADENWRGVMTLPRQTYLTKTDRVGWKLVTKPYDLRPIMGETLAFNESHANNTMMVDFSKVDSNAVYWEVNVTGIPEHKIPSTATLNFTFLSPLTAEYVRGGYYLGGDTPFYLDRGGAKGFDNVFFTDKFAVNSLPHKGTWSLSGVLDRSIIEVFLNGGVDCATAVYFATQPLTLMTLSTFDLPQGVRVATRVNALQSVWAAMENNDGLVHGNQSVNATGSEDIGYLLQSS